MYRIVGLAGKKGAGKNTAANQVVHPCMQFAFADELKRVARRWYALSHEQVYGDRKEVVDPRWGITPREIMQKLGAEVVRAIHPDTWVRYLLDESIPLRMDRGSPYAVITDVRFPNEVDGIHKAGGIVIRIDRPGLADNEFSTHESERHIDTLAVDIVVVNDSTPESLGRDVMLAIIDCFKLAGGKNDRR